MRLVPLAVALVCGCRDTQVSYPRDHILGGDTLYVTIDRQVASERDVFASNGDGDRDYRERSEPYGAVEVDLRTAACRWREGRSTARAQDPGFRPFEPSSELRVDASGDSLEPARLVHVPTGRSIDLRDRASVFVAGDQLLVRDRSGAWLVVDRELAVHDTIAFPIGTFAAIAPGRALFDSPYGAIAFHNGDAALPQGGVRPPRTVAAGWAAKQPLAAGQEAHTPAGFRLRAVERGGKLALAVGRLDQLAVFPATSITYFTGTEYVALGTALVDVSGGVQLAAPVRDLLAFHDGIYLRLADGAVWFTALAHRIDLARPLAVELDPVAIRGDRIIFHAGRGDALYILDRRTRSWLWRGYSACIPAPARG